MKFKYIIVLLFIFCSYLSGLAESTMYVQLTSGDILYYRLDKQPVVTYSIDELTITTDLDSTRTIPLHNLRRIVYDNFIITDIEDTLFLDGPISIFSITGNCIGIIANSSEFSNLNLPIGVYILQHGNISKKILK